MAKTPINLVKLSAKDFLPSNTDYLSLTEKEQHTIFALDFIEEK